MNPRASIHPAAEAEYLDAVQYFETAWTGLGVEFVRNVDTAIDSIRQDVRGWPSFPGWSRLTAMRTRAIDHFPYRIVYFTRDDEFVIVSLAPQGRQPSAG